MGSLLTTIAALASSASVLSGTPGRLPAAIRTALSEHLARLRAEDPTLRRLMNDLLEAGKAQ